MRSGILWVYFAHPAWHVRIEAGDERDAGSTARPGRTDSGNRQAQHHGERDCNPCNADSLSHVSYGLHNPLQNADVAFADGKQQDQRGRNVERARDHSAPGYSSGHGPNRVTNFVPHDRGKFEADQSEVKHDGRHIEHVISPITPAGEKSVEVAELFLGPEINSALARVTM